MNEADGLGETPEDDLRRAEDGSRDRIEQSVADAGFDESRRRDRGGRLDDRHARPVTPLKMGLDPLRDALHPRQRNGGFPDQVLRIYDVPRGQPMPWRKEAERVRGADIGALHPGNRVEVDAEREISRGEAHGRDAGLRVGRLDLEQGPAAGHLRAADDAW